MKGQVWSMDSIIAVVVFMSAISAFLLLISGDFQDTSFSDLKSDSRKIPQMLLSSGTSELSIIEDDQVNVEKANELQKMDYENLKSLMGTKGDFCIYFEDKHGNVVNLSDIANSNEGVGIGSSEVNLSEKVKCSKP